MNVVKYSALENCIPRGIVPFAICINKNDKRNPEFDEFIETHYGLTVDKRGYICCICNVVLADHCRNHNYQSIRMQDKTIKQIQEFQPKREKQIDNKITVDIIFTDGGRIDSIALVETAIEDIEKGKVLIN